MDVARIEERIDRTAAGNTEVSVSLGGVKFQTMLEVMEAAKLLSISGPAIPKWLQGNPGGCWAIIIQAIEWGFSPIAVARMSYEVNGVVGYMAQLVHAVIESRAPLRGRLRCEYEGEADGRVCVVTGHMRGEADPLVYRSPQVSKITPKNSPLWKSDVDQQLWFYSSRAWCRRYCPDVLLGVYSKEDLEDSNIGPDRARDITPEKPSIGERLKSKGQRGFDEDHVSREIGDKAAGKEPTPAGEAQQANTGGADENVNASHSGTDAATKESAAIDEAKKSGASAPQDGGDKPQKQSNADAGADAPNEERGSPDKNAKTSDGGKQPSTDFEQADDVIETEGDLVDASARGEAETATHAGSASTSQESDPPSSSGRPVPAGDKGRAGAAPDAGASPQQPADKPSIFREYADKMNATKSVDGLKGAHRKFREVRVWPDDEAKRQMLKQIHETCEARLTDKITPKAARETLIDLIDQGERLQS